MDEKETTTEVTNEEVTEESVDTQDNPEEKEETQPTEPTEETEEAESTEGDKEEVTEENPEEEKKEDVITDDVAKEANPDKATEVLKDKGFDYAELQKEYNETGEISKETRDKLAEVGITEEIVNNYIEGQKARVEQELNEIAQVVGGRESLNEIIKWASTNLSDEEKASINAITDANVMKVYLKDLKNRMEEKEGKVPEGTITGEGGQPPVELYESQAQMFEAIRDPRYSKDEVYRAKVMKKIAASREAGIDLGI